MATTSETIAIHKQIIEQHFDRLVEIARARFEEYGRGVILFEYDPGKRKNQLFLPPNVILNVEADEGFSIEAAEPTPLPIEAVYRNEQNYEEALDAAGLTYPPDEGGPEWMPTWKEEFWNFDPTREMVLVIQGGPPDDLLNFYDYEVQLHRMPDGRPKVRCRAPWPEDKDN